MADINAATGVPTAATPSVFSDMGAYIDMINRTTRENNAAAVAAANNANAFAAQQQRIAMEFNAKEAQKNRDWQEYMSNTAHQREVADLSAAGLNPILSAGGGNGAAVTSGAAASTSQASSQKAEVDMSLSTGLVNLLSQVISSQTALEQANMSALTNLTTTDRINQTNEMIAQMGNLNQREIAEIQSQTALATGQMSASAVLGSAGINSETSKYLAQNYPSTWPQALASLFAGALGDPEFYSKNGYYASKIFKDYNNWTADNRRSLLGRIKDFYNKDRIYLRGD